MVDRLQTPTDGAPVDIDTAAHADVPVGPDPVAGRPRVVAVAVVPARRGHVIAALTRVVEGGGSALLITAQGTPPPDLPAGVEAIDLVADERRVGVHVLLTRSPLRPVRRLLGRPSGGASLGWRAWSGSRAYRAVRPWVLWRALRRRLDEVDVDALDHVVIVALECWPITWQLCRRQPRATYTWDVPDEVFERVGRRPPQREQ